jgi:hypothetical protein
MIVSDFNQQKFQNFVLAICRMRLVKSRVAAEMASDYFARSIVVSC